MLRDLAIPDFLDKLNSSEPTPGGGGCAVIYRINPPSRMET